MDAKIDQAKVELHGSKIIAAIKGAGVEFVLSVPDIHTSHGLLRPIIEHHAPTLARVLDEYKGKVRIVWKDMPLPFHPNAGPAALAARLAQRRRQPAGIANADTPLLAGGGDRFEMRELG